MARDLGTPPFRSAAEAFYYAWYEHAYPCHWMWLSEERKKWWRDRVKAVGLTLKKPVKRKRRG